MADHKTFAAKRSALYKVDPRRLKVKEGLNLRDLSTPDNREHIETLARSIEANGFLESEPLEVAQLDGEFYVTAGHCRLAAVMMLIERGVPIETVPYVPERPGTNEIDRFVNQVISNNGKPPTPMEIGYNAKRLLGLGLDVAEIAKRFGLSTNYVSGLVGLQAAPAEVRESVKAGEIAASTAVAILREEGETKGAETVKAAVATAKAKGKKKATRKHVERVPAFAVKAKGDDKLRVVIDGNVHIYPRDFWSKLAHAILDESHEAEIAEKEAA